MIKKYALAFIITACLFSSCSNNKENTEQEKPIKKTFLDNVTTIEAKLSNQMQELTLCR